MAITVTSLQTIVSTAASATQTSTLTSTLTITPNPLTTAFEPPSYCTQSYLSNCQTDAVSGTLPCFVSIYPQAVCDSNGQACYPPIPGALDNSYIYSPGLSCPSGWSTAWKEVRTPGADEETTAHCCPTYVLPTYLYTNCLLCNWAAILSPLISQRLDRDDVRYILDMVRGNSYTG